VDTATGSTRRRRSAVTTTRTTELQDSTVDTKVVLSGCWISTLFVFAYVDIFGFWRADVIDGAPS
jgi:hypothetical protein